MNKSVVSGLVAILLGTPALAATIDVGDHELFENMADQQVQIFVVPGDPVEEVVAMDLLAQIADGGPDLGLPGSHIDGPEFTDVDMMTGTIWPFPYFPIPWILAGRQILMTAMYDNHVQVIEPDGLLVTLTIDTTGFFADHPNNPWELKLTDTLDIPTTLLDPSNPPRAIPLTITNGTIRLIPEPSTLLMLASLLAAAVLSVRTNRSR